MSNVSNSHNVTKLDKSSKALTGQRMARVIAKKNKEGNYESSNLQESKFVSIPVIVPEFNSAQINALSVHIVGMLNDAQDALIRERIIDGASAVHDEEISIDACIRYMDDAAKGNRVTKEYLQKWFVDTYFDAAAEFVCAMAKFDANALTSEQENVIQTKVNVLRDMFSGFSGGKYRPEIPQCKAMIKFGEFLTAANQDARMGNFVAKALSVKNEREAELSNDALGF